MDAMSAILEKNISCISWPKSLTVWEGCIDTNLALVQVVAWFWYGCKLSAGLMITETSDAVCWYEAIVMQELNFYRSGVISEVQIGFIVFNFMWCIYFILGCHRIPESKLNCLSQSYWEYQTLVSTPFNIVGFSWLQTPNWLSLWLKWQTNVSTRFSSW